MTSNINANLAKMTFIEKFSIYFAYDTIMMKYKLMSYKNDSDEYGAEIDWTNIAVSMLYRSFLNISFEEKKALLNGIREHKNQIKWDALTEKPLSNELDFEFLYEFYKFINWNLLIMNSIESIPQELIDLADEENLINWEAISAYQNLSKDFLINNIDKIDWKIYLGSHQIKNIPIELWEREQFIIAVRQNPDLINLKNDKASIAELNARLKKYVWIDRVAGVEGHFQDDTGLWIDTLRGEAADDADNLESDLEHTLYDAFHDEHTKEKMPQINNPEYELEL